MGPGGAASRVPGRLDKIIPAEGTTAVVDDLGDSVVFNPTFTFKKSGDDRQGVAVLLGPTTPALAEPFNMSVQFVYRSRVFCSRVLHGHQFNRTVMNLSSIK